MITPSCYPQLFSAAFPQSLFSSFMSRVSCWKTNFIFIFYPLVYNYMQCFMWLSCRISKRKWIIFCNWAFCIPCLEGLHDWREDSAYRGGCSQSSTQRITSRAAWSTGWLSIKPWCHNCMLAAKKDKVESIFYNINAEHEINHLMMLTMIWGKQNAGNNLCDHGWSTTLKNSIRHKGPKKYYNEN